MVDRGEEPLAIELDDRLVEGDLLRLSTATWFEIGLLDPVVNGGSGPIDSELISIDTVFLSDNPLRWS